MRIDPDSLDRSRGRPHSEADMGPFQGRTGGAGGRQQSLAVPQDHLSIRSHVDDQDLLLAAVRFFGNQDGHIVRPDEPGLDGQKMDVGCGMSLQLQFPCLDVEGTADGRREGGDPQRPGIDAQQEMVHDRVADNRQFKDSVGGDAAFGRYVSDQAVKISISAPVSFSRPSSGWFMM